jgi:rhodanese-related sulfurtransferase
MSVNGSPLKKYLSTAELKKITDAPDSNIWIIDLRPASFYKSGHIPTAKSYPDIMSKLNEIPKDKYLILYCILSPGAQMAIKKLENAGYTRNLNWGRYSRWPYESEKGK